MARFLRSAVLVLFAAGLMGGCSTLEVSEDDSPGVILEKAEKARDRGLFSKAIDNYQRLESLYPYSRETLQAQLMTAYTYYLKGDALPAVHAAERFIRLHPRNPHVDYALYLKGIAHYAKVGKPDRDPEHAQKAIEAFRQLIRQHPGSHYVPDALKRMHALDRILARHELHVAHYYLDREAFVATVNRCHRILTRHAGTPTVEPALAVLARAYARLGLDELARETLAILAHNYPESPELPAARAAVEGAPVTGAAPDA